MAEAYGATGRRVVDAAVYRHDPRQMHSAAMRVRHAMAFASHRFFNDRGFAYIHTPIITAADCEGAGEQFVVSTLLPEAPSGHDAAAAANGHSPGGPPMTPSGHVDYTKVGHASLDGARWSGLGVV